MGYDGLELACWGDHFDVGAALDDPGYCGRQRALLEQHGLQCHAISNHLVGQAVCDRIDERHQAILSPAIWGDGDPEGVRGRAAEELKRTARAAKAFGVDVVNGFTGSSVWHSIYAFPPTGQDYWDAGFRDFGDRFGPILDAFAAEGVRFGLEVHPTEIAFDIASSERAIEAVGGHASFGFNYDPSHLAYQGVDYVRFIRAFGDRIFHAHMKDVWWGHGDGTVGVFGGHTSFGDARRYWDFRSVGRGDVRFEDIIVALNDVGYEGPLSIEWEDSRMDREHGATESAAFVKRLDFAPSAVAFDAAFDKEAQ
jgi:sugar phosphate isomerase/epimerase